MGVNLWLSGVLVVCLFWCVGVYNRITRLRSRSSESFAAVAASLARYRSLVLEYVHPNQAVDTPVAFQHLLMQLKQLDYCTVNAASCPWDPMVLMALSQAGGEISATWGVLRTAPADLAGAALPDTLIQDWDANTRAVQHAVRSFNQMSVGYNDAIGQFPAVFITNFLGFKPAGNIAIFHEK